MNSRFMSAVVLMTVLFANAASSEAGFTLYVSEGNQIDSLNQNGKISTFATGLQTPFGLALDSAGDLYVNDFNGSGILRYSPTGAFLGVFASTANIGQGVGLAFDSFGNLYTPVFNGSYVNRFSPTGTYLGVFASTIYGTGSAPTGLAFDGSGNLYVSNSSGNVSSTAQGNIVEFSPTGAFLRVFASQGVNAPQGLAFDSVGDLYVTNLNNDTITEYSPTGAYLGVFASTGLDGPRSVAFDSVGDLYVTNLNNGTITEYSPSGAYLGVLVSGLSSPEFLAFATSTVPEPTSRLLLGIGVLSLLGSRSGCLRRWLA